MTLQKLFAWCSTNKKTSTVEKPAGWNKYRYKPLDDQMEILKGCDKFMVSITKVENGYMVHWWDYEPAHIEHKVYCPNWDMVLAQLQEVNRYTQAL